MSNIVEIKNLEKSFKNVTAVDGISLNIKEKEIFGLLGPNGAGKSVITSYSIHYTKLYDRTILKYRRPLPT